MIPVYSFCKHKYCLIQFKEVGTQIFPEKADEIHYREGAKVAKGSNRLPVTSDGNDARIVDRYPAASLNTNDEQRFRNGPRNRNRRPRKKSRFPSRSSLVPSVYEPAASDDECVARIQAVSLARVQGTPSR